MMVAADLYGLTKLKQACSGFIQCCVTVDTVCALLASANRYMQYKVTKLISKQVNNILHHKGEKRTQLGKKQINQFQINMCIHFIFRLRCFHKDTGIRR